MASPSNAAAASKPATGGTGTTPAPEPGKVATVRKLPPPLQQLSGDPCDIASSVIRKLHAGLNPTRADKMYNEACSALAMLAQLKVATAATSAKGVAS